MTVKLGMFTMPFHHPDRDSATILEEDQEAAHAAMFDQICRGRFMELLATDVMPKLERHAEATRA